MRGEYATNAAGVGGWGLEVGFRNVRRAWIAQTQEGATSFHRSIRRLQALTRPTSKTQPPTSAARRRTRVRPPPSSHYQFTRKTSCTIRAVLVPCSEVTW